MAVEVRPPDQRDEWQTSWYRERLAERKILEVAVVVVVGGAAFLAVPCGGGRRGGYVCADDTDVVWRLRDVLDRIDGFPDVRVRWSTEPDVCHAVVWGDPSPGFADDRRRGRFYGYSDEAIAAFVQETAARER